MGNVKISAVPLIHRKNDLSHAAIKRNVATINFAVLLTILLNTDSLMMACNPTLVDLPIRAGQHQTQAKAC